MFLIDLLFKKNIISNKRIRIIFHLILSDRPRKFSISTFYIHPIKVRGKDMSNLRLQRLYMYSVYYCYKSYIFFYSCLYKYMYIDFLYIKE